VKFRNKIDKPLSFDLGGKHYDVEVGGECDVPDRIAYAVEKHGLPLEPAKNEPKAVSKTIKLEPKAEPEPEQEESKAIEADDEDLLDKLTRPDPPKKKSGK